MSKLAAAFCLHLLVVRLVFSAQVVEDTIQKTVPLSASGTFSIEAIDGSVEIYGADTEQLKIVAIRKAFSPARLNAIKVQITAQPDAVRIKTAAPATARWGVGDRSGTVDYIITLPQHARIASIHVPTGEIILHGMRGASAEASLENGRLISHNCFCDQKLTVQNGGLDLFFDWAEDRIMKIETSIESGNARAIIPGDVAFELHATSTHGKVTSDFAEPGNRRRGGVSEIRETIGSPPLSELILRAKDGNIRIQELLW